MNRLDELEKRLAREVREQQVSPLLEAALLKEFDAHRRPARLRWVVPAAAAIAAAVAAAFWVTPKPPVKPQPVIARAVAPAVPVEVRVAAKPAPAPKRKRRTARPADPEPQFVRIPYSEPLAPYERAEIVRVEMPVSALAAAGLRVATADTAARAQADLVIGEDGLAHAVRVISVFE
jgi:hypothetical protein